MAEYKSSVESELGKKERELNRREMQIRAKELLSEKGLPKELAGVLQYSDEESLTAAIELPGKTRGFKTGDDKQQTERKVLPNDLQVGNSEGSTNDLIRKAMRLK